MPREIVNPPEIHPPPGYSHVVTATGSRLAFVAGQAAIDSDFNVVGEGNLDAQTRQVMANLGHALEAIGATWHDVVNATVYTTEPYEYETIGRAMSEAMEGAPPPAQVIAGVSGLALPQLLIEISLVVSLR